MSTRHHLACVALIAVCPVGCSDDDGTSTNNGTTTGTNNGTTMGTNNGTTTSTNNGTTTGNKASAHVGSQDCAVILASTGDPATQAACEDCAGKECSTGGCGDYPCVDGSLVIQGCNSDDDCDEFEGALCGMYSAPDNICSFHPDDA